MIVVLITFLTLLSIICFVSVAGGIIGAVVGALIGFKDKTNLLQDVIMGATSGAALSQKITTATFQQLLYSDHDDEHGCFLHLVNFAFFLFFLNLFTKTFQSVIIILSM